MDIKKLQSLNCHKYCCIWGNGSVGKKRVYPLLRTFGFRVDSFCTNYSFNENCFDQIPIIKPEELYKKEDVIVFVAIEDKKTQNIVTQQLNDNKIYNICILSTLEFCQICDEIDKSSEEIKNKYKDIYDDKTYSQYLFNLEFGRKIDFEHPLTFNEKIQWLKIYDRNPQYSLMVDKFEVKKRVAQIIGDEYVIPVIGVWDSFDEIDFDLLPDRFVLKTTHDSGGIVICQDKKKFNVELARQEINWHLKRNFYWIGREWPYKNVRPRIIVEEYLEDSKLNELRDYKFFCFNGKVRCFKTDFDRYKQHRANYYDKNGNIINVGEVLCPPDYSRNIALPSGMELMIELAEKIAFISPFLRVDFYEVDGKVYCGELTFYPNAGFGKFIDDKSDDLLGSWLDLN